MTHTTVFRSLAYAACSWLCLAVIPAYAQEPTLAEGAEKSDLGDLLNSAVQKRGTSVSSGSRVRAAGPVARFARVPDASPAQEAKAPNETEKELQSSKPFQPVVQGAAPELNTSSTAGEEQTEIIRERYTNRRVKIEREVMQDDQKNYHNHGSWKFWDEQGNLLVEGRYDHGIRQGIWKRWHARKDSRLFAQYPYNQFAEPFISQAEFNDGVLDGNWVIYDGNQRKISQWSFINGQRDGLSLWWHPNGKQLREISYKEGAIHGEILEYSDSGVLTARNNFEHGRMLAPRVERYKDGAMKSQAMYLHAPIVLKEADDWWNAAPAVFTSQGKDERHGEWLSWYPNGQQESRGFYKNDKADGTFIWWYANGQKSSEGNYVIDRQDGSWVWWHENGQKSVEGTYTNGEQMGRWTMWNEKGRVTQASEHIENEATAKSETKEPNSPLAIPSITPAYGDDVDSAPEPQVETARTPRLLNPGSR